jgi:hypothetical protein
MTEITDINSINSQLIQYLCLIIGQKIYKYDFFDKSIQYTLQKIVFNMILSVIIALAFTNIIKHHIDNAPIPKEITGMFMCYWFSMSITNNMFQVENINQLDIANKIIFACKEVTLNFIIFAGLLTIYNLFR